MLRVKRIPSPIPHRAWHLKPLVISLAGGLLPFGSVFIELYFVYTRCVGLEAEHMLVCVRLGAGCALRMQRVGMPRRIKVQWRGGDSSECNEYGHQRPPEHMVVCTGGLEKGGDGRRV